MLKIVKTSDNGYYYFNELLENIGHSYILEKEFIRIYAYGNLYYLYFNGNIEEIKTDMERYYKNADEGWIGKCTETRILYYDIDTFIEDHKWEDEFYGTETETINIITETAKLLNINLKRAD